MDTDTFIVDMQESTTDPQQNEDEQLARVERGQWTTDRFGRGIVEMETAAFETAQFI